MAKGLAKSTNQKTAGVATYLQLAMELCKEKPYISLNKLAEELGCNYYTIRRYNAEVPEFHAAFVDSRQRAVDLVKEHAWARATDPNKPSDLMAIYMMNNFDEEIVERLSKNRDQTITIKLDVPSKPVESVEGWAREVQALPEADYRHVEEPASAS